MKSSVTKLLEITQQNTGVFGRSDEVNLILSLIKKSSQDKSQSIIISGPSGIGKSRLVEHALSLVKKDTTLLLSTKYDQFGTQNAGEELTNLLSIFLNKLLASSENELTKWKKLLSEHLGHNAKVISDVVSELSLFIDNIITPPFLNSSEAQIRFEITLIDLFHFICKHSKYLIIIFIDDLQWANLRTLRILDKILNSSELKNMLFIGATRDDNESLSHIKDFIINKKLIKLESLNKESVHEYITVLFDKSNISSSRIDLLIEKTHGNPFHLTQYLFHLLDKEILKSIDDKWILDEKRLKEEKVAPNVASILLSRMESIKREELEFLKICAIAGNRVEINLIKEVLNLKDKEYLETLDVLDNLNFINIIGHSEVIFSHDKIQEVSYNLCSTELKNEMHKRIGIYYLNKKSSNDTLFNTCYHLNLCINILDSFMINKLIELNVEAADLAMLSSNFKLALDFITKSYDQIENNLKTEHENICLKKSELLYLNGKYDECEDFINKLMLNYNFSTSTQAKFLNQLVIQYTAQGRYDEAIQAGKKAIQFFDINLPDDNLEQHIQIELNNVDSRIKNIETFSLNAVPEMTSEDMKIVISILINMDSPCYLSNIKLYNIIVAKMVIISIDYGLVPASAKAFASYGIVLSSLAKYKQAREFCELGIAIAHRFNHLGQLCRACHTMANHVQYWTQHVKEGDAFNDKGYYAGHDSGEYLWAGFIKLFKPYNQFFRSRNLNHLLSDIEEGLAYCHEHPNQLAIDALDGLKILIQSLSINSLDTDADEEIHNKFVEKCHKTKSLMSLSMYFSTKCFIYILQNNISAAEDIIDQSIELNKFSNAVITNFYDDFSKCFLEIVKTNSYQDIDHDLFNKHYSQIEVLSASCPENFLHFKLLLDAEIKILQGEFYSAIEILDKASSSASSSTNTAMVSLIEYRLYVHWKKHKPDSTISSFYYTSYLKNLKKWGVTSSLQKSEISPPSSSITSILNVDSTNLKTAEILTNSISIISKFTKFKNICFIKIEQEKFDTKISNFDVDLEKVTPYLLYTNRTGFFLNSTDIHNEIYTNLNYEDKESIIIAPISDSYLLLMQSNKRNIVLSESEGQTIRTFLRQLSLILENIEKTNQLAKFNLKLEESVKERTKELKNERDRAHEILNELKQTQRQLIIAAKDSGRSEIAANIIHNVGNSSMYIKGRIELLKNSIEEDNSIDALNMINSQIKNHKNGLIDFISSSDTGKLLPQYIDEISSSCSELHDETISSLDKLMEKVDQLIYLLRSENGYNKSYEVLQYVNISQLINESIQLANLENIEVVTHTNNIHSQFALDQEKVKNILINLLSNASDAVRATDSPNIIISVRKNDSSFILEVLDNGIGLHYDQLELIFSPGYSTKSANLSGGYGLHNSSIISQNLGGSLTAKSDGVNMGAKFTLTLPWKDKPN